MKRDSGFSLIEIMIAFVIMSIALTIVIRVFSTGLRTVSETEKYNIAVQIAESLMARVGEDISLDESQMTGEIEKIYDWQINIEPMFVDYKLSMVEQPNSNMQFKTVNVRVEWGDDEKISKVELNTIKPQIR